MRLGRGFPAVFILPKDRHVPCFEVTIFLSGKVAHMTISVVSANSGNNPPAALAGSGRAGEGDAGGFGGLFAFLLSADEVSVGLNPVTPLATSETSDADPVRLDPDTLASGFPAPEAPPLAGVLSGAIQASFHESQAHHEAKSIEEDADLSGQIPILSLTPEVRQGIRQDKAWEASPDNARLLTNRYGNLSDSGKLVPEARQMEERANLMPQGAADFAASLEKIGAEKSSALLRERLPQGHNMATNIAANQTAAPNASPPQPTAAASGLQTPVYDPEWAQEFGEKIVWMARNDQQQARLSLNPAHLGPLQITLNLDADKASATFMASAPEARQALEEALPRLREMLAGAGISLGDAQVDTQSRQENAPLSHERSESHPGNSADAAILDDNPLAERAVPVQHGEGLVDLFV
jgi:flagellar hook-length control protein FliK